MRILIMGSSGLLGSTIAQQLSGTHELLGLDVVPGPWTQHLISVGDREALFSLMGGVDAVIHTASLHQPQVATHSIDAFLATNVNGTLNLLEAAVHHHVRRFVYTSTTSVYGHAMVPHRRAVWVTEDLAPIGRDIYDFTKLSAERMCHHFACNMGLSVVCLRVARFFKQSPFLTALYRLYRGVDVRDAAEAHVLALEQPAIPFALFNIAAHSPFLEADMPALLQDAPAVLRERDPEALQLFARNGWSFPRTIDRVYVIEKAQRDLHYRPRYNFYRYIQEYSLNASSNS